MATEQAIQIIGLQEVEGALRALPVVMRPFFGKAARYGQERMRLHAKPQHSGPAKLAQVVAYDIRGQAGTSYNLEAHIGFLGKGFGMRSSVAALAGTIDRGRRPGKPPSIRGLHAWLRLMGAHVNPRVVQQDIAQHGTKGKQMLQYTADDLTAKLPEIVRETEAEIMARWPKG